MNNYKLFANNSFRAVSSHAVQAFSKWDYGKPSYAVLGLDCVCIQGTISWPYNKLGLWNNVNCNEKHNFICAKGSPTSQSGLLNSLTGLSPNLVIPPIFQLNVPSRPFARGLHVRVLSLRSTSY